VTAMQELWMQIKNSRTNTNGEYLCHLNCTHLNMAIHTKIKHLMCGWCTSVQHAEVILVQAKHKQTHEIILCITSKSQREKTILNGRDGNSQNTRLLVREHAA
jgi:hypothetical protein